MRWRVEFHHERRAIVAAYTVEAPRPPDAMDAGRHALFAEYPAIRRRARGLFERAQRLGGKDPSGWALHRIVKV